MITSPIHTDYSTKISQPEVDSLLMVNQVYAPTDIHQQQVLMATASTTTIPELMTENSSDSSDSNITVSKNNDNNNNNSKDNKDSTLASTEEAALPPTYAALPTTKLEEEPNPFEQSFEVISSGPSTIKKPTSKLSTLAQEDRNTWDNMRMGVLQASTSNASAALNNNNNNNTNNNSTPSANHNHVSRRPSKYQIETTTVFHAGNNNNNNSNKRSRHVSDSSNSETSFIVTTSINKASSSRKSKKAKSIEPEDEEKRKNFLERNRIAALKCRQRKKQWLQSLQAKVEYLSADNEQFHMQANALREELIHLKTLLMVHKDCPIDHQAVKQALSRPIPGIPIPNVSQDFSTNTINTSSSSSSRQ